ncbi:MAG: hypothetical protein CME06_14865 [Gemmatimonadetes bacterium]|nr:hypothetical protein [Gemmatimonadota bacterium]
MRHRSIPLFTALVALAQGATAAEAPGRHALIGATVVRAPGDTLRNASILIEDGLIRAVGERIDAGDGTRIWSHEDHWIYSGLIDAHVEAGLGEAADREPSGDQHPHAEMRAEFSAAGAFALDEAARKSYRDLGFTALNLSPNRGIFRGTSALVALSDGQAGANLLRGEVQQVIAFQRELPNDETYPSSLMGVIAFIRQTWLDADHQREALAAWERSPDRLPRPDRNRGLRALLPSLDGDLPVELAGSNALDALRAARIAGEAELDYRILGSGLEYEHLEELAKLKAPFIVPLRFPARLRVEEMDDDERQHISLRALRRWHHASGNAAALRDAEVPIALTTHGLESPADFPAALRRAIDAGLSHEDALAALTTTPAELCGVSSRTGSIRRGHAADLLISDGPIFDEATQILAVWIDGRHHWGSGSLATDEAAHDAEVKDEAGAEEEMEPPAQASAVASARPSGPVLSPRKTLFRNATIWTQSSAGILEHADLLVERGRIHKIGQSLSAPKGAHVVDASGRHLTPGLIDAHSHIAIDGGVNEGTESSSAQVRIGDVLNPNRPIIYRQLAGGVTTSHLMHGSANAMGGQNATIKLRWGTGPDGLHFTEAPPTIKFALGENVKQSNWGEKYTTRFPQTRNGVEAFIRERFSAARDYMRRSEEKTRGRLPQRIDLELETLAEILRGERFIHCHAYRQDEMLMLLRVAEDFGFRVACFQHALEGYKVADEIAAAGTGASTFSDWWAYKFEVKDAIPWNGALMTRRGVTVSFNSDSGEMARRLNTEAAKAIKYGDLGEEEALALVTINPARQLRIDHRVGSLEIGKDADLALWTDDPLSTLSVCDQTWVDGQLYFDRSVDREIQAELRAEHESLLALAEGAAEKEGDEEEDEDGDAAAADRSGATESVVTEDVVDAAPVAVRQALRSQRASTDHSLGDGAGMKTTALVGGTVHTMVGTPLRGGVLLMRGGEIIAVGNDFPIPAGTKEIDVEGLHIYPGLFDAKTHLGLVEIDAVRASNDIDEVGRVRPEIRAEVGLNPDSDLIPVARLNGITHALCRPKGGLISGSSAVIQLDGWTWEEMTLLAPAGLNIVFPSVAIDYSEEAKTPIDEQRTERRRAIRELDDTFAEARAYISARAAAEKGAGPPVEEDRRWEAMRGAIAGTSPVLIEANEAGQIKAAVRWATEQELAPVIVGGRQAWRCARWLAERRVPILLDGAHRLPARDWDRYDSVFRSAAVLRDAGVRFGITYAWDSNVRNLPYVAASSAAFGLSSEEALSAITLYPAEILGVDDRIGSLAAGMDASLIVTTGDPLDIRTRIEHLFIGGRRVPLESKQTRLWERYRNRPMRR